MFILSNHPDDMQAYVNERMFVSAPMTTWAVNNDGAMSWSMVTEMEGELTNEQREVLELNRKFGVLAGYTISFPDPSPVNAMSSSFGRVTARK
jgi:LuxR family transcriptional regulator